uniref:Uncharacterized protein n=1 Tax=viral metagenome TaxID=1070528 RepID=A0A6C0F554_9ZZZZ
MDECDELFAELEAATKEKDDYIKRLEADLEDKNSYIKQLEKRVKLLEKCLESSVFIRKPKEPESLKFDKEELTRSLVMDFYKGKLSYDALLSRVNPKH